MEKPDANGFVSINWPSRNIPHGGVFHNLIAEPSPRAQRFLKVLLEESKLSIAQRQKSKWENQLRRDEEPAPDYRQPSQLQVPLVRPRTSRRRSLSEIRGSGVFDSDGFQPLKRGEDREKLKQRLQQSMAFGDSEQQSPPKPPRAPKPPPAVPTAKETRHELLTQIRERVEWLAEMEDLGQAAAHRDIVQGQIAERIRALDALGLDSECSTDRSTASGFSTLRSREPLKPAAANAVNSVRSKASARDRRSSHSSVRRVTKKEENVAAYNDVSIPKLMYSPRRRC